MTASRLWCADRAQRQIGRTPLSRDVKGPRCHVKLLIEIGADTESRDYNSRTPLSRAADKGQEKVVAALLDAGANTDIRESSGRTRSLSRVA